MKFSNILFYIILFLSGTVIVFWAAYTGYLFQPQAVMPVAEETIDKVIIDNDTDTLREDLDGCRTLEIQLISCQQELWRFQQIKF